MSKQHPVVAVTGSSGAGTTTVKRAFEHIFEREGIKTKFFMPEQVFSQTRSMRAYIEALNRDPEAETARVGVLWRLFEYTREGDDQGHQYDVNGLDLEAQPLDVRPQPLLFRFRLDGGSMFGQVPKVGFVNMKPLNRPCLES